MFRNLSYELVRTLYFGLPLATASSGNMLLPTGSRGPVHRDEVAVRLSLNR